MTHAEVKGLWEGLNILIQYIAKNEIKNTYLSYGLKKNARILEKATKLIQESTNPELIELEKKAYTAGEHLQEGLSDEAKANSNPYPLGFQTLTEEERAQHAELAKEYNEFLQKESDVKLYMLEFKEVQNTEMEWQPSSILENFIKD